MAVITRSVGSFNKTSKHGETAYGTVVSFNMPAFVSITEVKATFTTLGGGGDTQDRAFIINGTRAHAGNVWPTSGINLNVGLVVAGNNTFRVTLKSQPDGMDYGTMCTWNISNITLTITYTEPISNPGTISLNKASMDAGETVVISMTAADVGVTRTIEVFFGSEVVAMSTVVSGAGAGANTYDYTFPLASCTKMPNSTSGTIKVKMTGSVGSPVEKTMTIKVPSTVVPTLTNITDARQANGVDGSIAEYVQKYSGVTLTINGAAGAHGSTISKYEIIGGGFSANASPATFSPLPNDGETVFIGKITDSRGRTATKSVSIIVRPYSNPTLTDPSAFRSDDQGVIADAGEYVALKAKIVFSSINGKNTAGIEGRVFEKGTAPPSWESMTDDTTEVLGGALAINKIYTAQIKVEDKISSYIHNIEIGTATIGANILPEGAGVSFGGYAEAGKIKLANKAALLEGDVPEWALQDGVSGLILPTPIIGAEGSLIDEDTGLIILGNTDNDTQIDSDAAPTINRAAGSFVNLDSGNFAGYARNIEKTIYMSSAAAPAININTHVVDTAENVFIYAIIYGNSYGAFPPIYTMVQGYMYGPSTWVHVRQRNFGYALDAAVFGKYGGTYQVFIGDFNQYARVFVRLYIAGESRSNFSIGESTYTVTDLATNKITATVS